MHRSLFARAAAFEALLALVALGVGSLVGVSPAESLRFSWAALLLGLAATAPPAAGLLALERAESGWAVRIRQSARKLLGPLFTHAGWREVALLSLAAGVGEEMLFRGLLQQGLSNVWGSGVALVVASATFGVLHWLTPGYAVLAGLGGLYLGALYLATGNLLVPMVVHAAYDMVALWLLVVDVRSGREGP